VNRTETVVDFTDAETAYLATQRFGRLATAQPDGTLQVNPVSYRHNAASGAIDIRGFNLSASRKFRNVADNGRVAFVVDDIPSVEPFRVRCLEIRGHAEAISPGPGDEDVDAPVIRIHPRRIISFGIDEDREPHQLTLNARTITE
jgi:pyridoxamine 5'-phosphate oxidase family protein